MPLYEYICDDCQRKFSWLVGVTADDEKPSCPRCGSKKYHKIMSRVVRGRSEEAALEDFAEEDFGDLEDPKQARQFAKKMSGEFGEELGEDFEQEVESAFDEDAGGAAGADEE